MDLQELIARGALVTAPAVERSITWQPKDQTTGEPVGDKVTTKIYIRRPSAGWLDRARMAAASDPRGASFNKAIISHAIFFGENQDQQFSEEQAEILDDDLANAIMDAYHDATRLPKRAANGEDKKEAFAKNSEPTPGSMSNSPDQASAAEPLEKSANA